MQGQCLNANAVASVPARLTGNTSIAQSIGSVCGDVAQASKAAWFSVVGNGTTLYATTCDASTLYSTQLVFFISATNSSDCSNLACGAPVSTYNGESCGAISWYAEVNITYWLVVTGTTFDVAGAFTLNIDVSPLAQCTLGSTSVVSSSYYSTTGDTSATNSPLVPLSPYLPSH